MKSPYFLDSRHIKAENRHQAKMDKAVKQRSLKEFEREGKNRDKFEARAEARDAKKYDKETF
jgi:hypothetical protein